MSDGKPKVPSFPDDNAVAGLFTQQPVGPQLDAPGVEGQPEMPFPPPRPPGPEFADLALQDLDNYAPPEALRDEIVCFGCQFFWRRLILAASWSTRPQSQRRKEGRATCLFTSPPTALQGEYVTECNQFQPKKEVL